jgi:hypothetical protein
MNRFHQHFEINPFAALEGTIGDVNVSLVPYFKFVIEIHGTTKCYILHKWYEAVCFVVKSVKLAITRQNDFYIPQAFAYKTYANVCILFCILK